MGKRLLVLLVFICFWGVPFLSYAQQYNIKAFSTKSGLANSTVNNIFLDTRGYLWFSTQGGVSRFDGRFFKNYTSHDGLPGIDITSVTEDLRGNIWITTNNFGVSKFDGKTFTNYSTKDGLGSDVVYSAYVDTDNKIWFATFGGISCFDGKSFTNLTTKDGLPSNEFFAVTGDQHHNLWFGMRKKGLCKYDPHSGPNGRRFTEYSYEDASVEVNVFTLQFDDAGKLWIGTTSKGVCFLEEGKIVPSNIDKLRSSFISSIRQDRHHAIWIGSDIGLYKYMSGRAGTLFTEKNGLVSANIFSLCEDYEGNIWAGTGLGVNQFRNEALVTFTEKEGLVNNKTITFTQTRSGEYLLSCSGAGLSSFDGHAFHPVPIKELAGTNVQALCEDSKQRLWVGFESNFSSSLMVLEKKNGVYALSKSYHNLCGKQITTISRIVEGQDGDIWIASFGNGIFRVHGNEVAAVPIPNDSLNNVLTLFQDSKGRLWFGSSQEGLLMFDGSKWQHFSKKNGLPDNTVWCITEDKKGNIFLGTAESGIVCFDGKKFNPITSTEGLVSNLVYSLLVDAKGKLWAGTDKGIVKMRVNKDFTTDSVKFYGEQEGLMGTEICQNGFFTDQSGKLWICTTNGLSRYSSFHDYINNIPPRILLNDIKLYYQDVDWTKYASKLDPITKLPINLSLGHKDNHLTFDYQALTTGNVHYTFKLEGLDADWSPLTTNTQAVYTNIPPGGNYIFKVKAVNSDGYWSDQEVSFSFRITPPFWKTWWFYTICILIIGGTVVLVIRRRTAKLEEEKRILEEKVEERTVELKGANDQLSLAFKDIKDSINYAQRIQQAILPLSTEIRKELPDHFIYFKPRDVVSGDFYWFNKKDGKIYIAACDCTGHGVPGAFMSIIGNSLLNEISHQAEMSDPGYILNVLRDRIILALKQQSGEQESKDGMDMMLCCIDKKNKKLSFAGANNPLYLIRKGELKEFKGNKQPIGVYGDVLKPFTNQELDLLPGDIIYIFSDGYPDQFGGPKGKKFLYTRFKELLLSISGRTMDQQYSDLDRAFWDWKMEHEQVDDVLVIGIRI